MKPSLLAEALFWLLRRLYPYEFADDPIVAWLHCEAFENRFNPSLAARYMEAAYLASRALKCK